MINTEKVKRLIKGNRIYKEDIEKSDVTHFSTVVGDLRKKGYKIHFDWTTGDYIVDKTPEDVFEEKAESENINVIRGSMQDTVLEHLIKFGKINAFEALQKYHCFNLSHPIHQLKKNGYDIEMDRTNKVRYKNPNVDRTQTCFNYILKTKPNPATVDLSKFEKSDVSATQNELNTYKIFALKNDCSTPFFVTVVNGDINDAMKSIKENADNYIKNMSIYADKNVRYEAVSIGFNISIFKFKKSIFGEKKTRILDFLIGIN